MSTPNIKIEHIIPIDTRKQLIEHHKRLCDQARKLMELKNTDYAGSAGSVYGNLVVCERIGYCSAELGVMIRLQDKLTRIDTLLKSDKVAVAEETIVDTIIDAINYLVLLDGLRRRRGYIEHDMGTDIPKDDADTSNDPPCMIDMMPSNNEWPNSTKLNPDVLAAMSKQLANGVAHVFRARHEVVNQFSDRRVYHRSITLDQMLVGQVFITLDQNHPISKRFRVTQPEVIVIRNGPWKDSVFIKLHVDDYDRLQERWSYWCELHEFELKFYEMIDRSNKA